MILYYISTQVLISIRRCLRDIRYSAIYLRWLSAALTSSLETERGTLVEFDAGLAHTSRGLRKSAPTIGRENASLRDILLPSPCKVVAAT